MDTQQRAALIINLIEHETVRNRRSFETLTSRYEPGDGQSFEQVLSEGLQRESFQGILTPLPLYIGVLQELGEEGEVDWSQVARHLINAYRS